MSSTPGRVTKSAAKRKQCGNCACTKMRHVKNPARFGLQRCLTGVSLLTPRGTCDCTQYREAWAVKPKVGAR